MSLDDDISAVRRLLAPANPVADPAVPPTELQAARAEVEAIGGGFRPLLPREQPRNPVRWRLAVAAVAACAALIVGVLIARTGNDTTTSGNPVLASYAATEEAGSARAAFDITLEDTHVTGEGVGSFETGEAAGAVQLPDPFGEVSFVSTGSTVYVEIPESFQPLVGKPWAELPEADVAALMELFLEDVGLSAPFNPADMLAYIKGVSGEVTEVGTETVRGEDTTRYQARIELTKVAATIGEDAQSALSDANLDLTVPADIWVDGEGRLRQLTMTLTSPIALTATFELWDFGATVDATPPPADQVGDISALLQGFFNTDD